MKICLISLHYSEYTYRLASALSRHHEVLLIVDRFNFINELDEDLLYKRQGNLNLYHIKIHRIKNPLVIYNVYQLVSSIRNFKPDVIHCQETLKACLYLSLPFVKKYPFVLTIHDHVSHSGADTQLATRNRFQLYKKRQRQHANAIIVHGKKISNETKLQLPWIKNMIFFINHGVLGEKSAYTTHKPALGSLLFFGRVEKYKGLVYFLDALDELNARGVKVKGLVAGSGSDLDNHRQRLSNTVNCDLMDYYLTPKQVQEVFLKSQIIVLPYTDATQSGVVSLALQYARPVVATDVGSLFEVVRDGQNGYIVPPGNSVLLADAIEKIIINPHIYEKMSHTAKQMAESEYSWESIAIKTIAVYQRVLSECQ